MKRGREDEREEEHVQYLLDNFENIRDTFFQEKPPETTSYEKPQEDSKPILRAPWPRDKRRPSRRYMQTRSPLPFCQHCGAESLVKDRDHGDVVCTRCCTCHDDKITADAFKCMPYDDYGRLKSITDSTQRRNCYKKSNYFNETLKQLSGYLDVPQSRGLWETVRFQDYMYVPVTAEDIRNVLKRHKLHRFYKHAAGLAVMVNRAEGNAIPPSLDHKEQDLMRYMFEKFNRIFSVIRGNRKNSLNYGYVTFQLLRLINRDDLCGQISMLKCRSRLQQHDQMWRRVCEATGWEFMAYLI